MELFRLLGIIALTGANEAQSDIAETTDRARTASDSIRNAFKKIGTAVVTYFAADKIKEFGLACINAASDAQAMESQFSQVFGDLEEEASEALSKIADDSGIVETRMKGSFTKIAAFAKTTGMDTADSLALADRAMVAVADSAAFYDRTLEETTESLQSFLKGNYENDAALGLSCTETTRNAAANKLYGQSFNDLSEAQKQLTLLQMVEDANALSGALGQAARESDTWTNQTGNLKQAWTDFTAAIGAEFLPAVVKVVGKLSEGVQWMTEFAGNGGVQGVINALKQLLPSVALVTGAFISLKAGMAIQHLVTGFQNAKVAISLLSMEVGSANLAQAALNGTMKAGEVIVALLTGKMTLAQLAQAAMTKGQAALNAVLNANPIGIIITIIGLLVTALIVLWNTNEDFRNAIISIWGKIKEVFSTVVSAIAKFFTETIPNAGKQMVNWFASLPSKMREIGVNIVQGLKNGIAQMWENLKNWFINKVNALVSGVKSILGIASPSKVFAGIGGFMAEGLGEGFDDQFTTVKKGIEDSMKFDAADASINVSGNVQKQAANAATATQNAQNSNDKSINLTVVSPDGKALARFIAPYMGAQLQLVRG